MTKQSSSKCLSTFALQISVSISCLFFAVPTSPAHAQETTKARPYVITLGELFSPNGAEGLEDGKRNLQQPYISSSADFGSTGGPLPLTFSAFADFAVPASVTHHHDVADYFNGVAPGTTKTTSSTIGLGVSVHFYLIESSHAIRPYIGAGMGFYHVHTSITEREQSIAGNTYTLPLNGLNYQTSSDAGRTGFKFNAGIETRSGLLFQVEALNLPHKDPVGISGSNGPYSARPDGTSCSVGYRF